MSVIFGSCISRGSLVEEDSLLGLARATVRYGRDGTNLLLDGRIGMGFQAFHTHHRSRSETQPAKDCLGNILVFDGRLDNYREIATTEGITDDSVPDSVLVLKMFARWGERCFSRLVGDWSLALWSAQDRILYLARDHAGSRTLFYRNIRGVVTWSSCLEAFFVDTGFPEPDPEYIARSLSSQPVFDLTPYQGIRAVPAAHYLALQEGKAVLRPHWRWVAETCITYRSDLEYDEHFLHLFRQAVQRRIVPGAQVLGELSGGMDSSSIVCMADTIVREDQKENPSIDTISYYDDTEPDWDERPYFAIVERQRNRAGIHIDCSDQALSYEPLLLEGRFYPYLGADRNSLDYAIHFEQSMGCGRYRVILSGIGGDELLGGVPTPMPELANHLCAGRLIKFLSSAFDWSLDSRQPLICTLINACTFTNKLYRTDCLGKAEIPPWLGPRLREICLQPASYPENRFNRLAAQPSAIANGRAWWAILETLCHLTPRLEGCYEYRYPYLDKDLVEFLHQIPREQLVRPGRRRLLMRRALKGIVPNEIIERKRKAHISRGPITKLRNAQEKIEALFVNSLSAEHGLIDQRELVRTLHKELTGDLRWIGAITRTIGVELWLRSFTSAARSLRFNAHSGASINFSRATSRSARSA